MTHPSKAAAVLYAKDIARVGAFYAEVMSLTVAHAEEDHMVLESATFQLAIVAIPARIAATIEIATPPVRRSETPIKLVFPVASIDTARVAAARRGGELNPAEREWQYQGSRVCDGHDPEGNVMQCRERAR